MKSTILGIGIALIVITTPGCRWGNREIDVPPSLGGGLSGYYETAPLSYTLCATWAGGSNCPTLSNSQIPTDVSTVITNPVAFVEQGTTEDYFLSPNSLQSDNPFSVTLTPVNNNQIYNNSQSQDALFSWANTSCVVTSTITLQGNVDPGGPLKISFSQPEAGRLSLDFKFLQALSGCTASDMTLFQNCYSDYNQCGGVSNPDNQNRQADVVGFFGMFTQAGALSTANISTTTQLSFEILYQ